MKKTIVILANSVKNHDHCVAGKCITTGKWVRPVSNFQGGALSDEQTLYQNNHGTFKVKTLLKIEMNFVCDVPLLHQPDNYLIDGSMWQQKYSINESELPHFADSPISLWGEDRSIPHYKIFSGQIKIEQSLYLVRVDDFSLYLNNMKRRALFKYGEKMYDLPVTDPFFNLILAQQNLGNHKSSRFVCVSLGQVFEDGNCYKILAKIF